MKKNFLVILLALAFPTFSVAQRRDAIPEIEEQLKQAVAKYDFDTAEELLETRILALTKKNCQQIMRKLNWSKSDKCSSR